MKSLLLSVMLLLATIQMQAQWNLTGNANATTTSILGTTNSVSLRLFTKNTPRLVIDTLGRIGIGITIPTTQLMVKGSGTTPAAIWTNIGKPVFAGFGETNVGNADFILGMASSTLFNAIPRFAGRRSRGTLAVPTAVISGDQLMSFSAFGYDGTTFQNPAEIQFTVDGTPVGTAVPTGIILSSGTNGVSRTERLRVGSNGDITFNTSQLFVQKSNGNVGLGTVSPAANAILDMNSSTKGILIPRLTTAQRNAIATPTGGLMVYNTSTNAFSFYNGTAWKEISTLGGTNGSAIADADGDTKVQTEQSANENVIRFSLAGTEYMKLNRNPNGLAVLHLINNDASTIIGNGAGALSAPGGQNCFIGTAVGAQNTSGALNTIVGTNAFAANVFGSNNVAVGANTLLLNTDGGDNTAIGSEALNMNNSGDRNTAVGMWALRQNNDGYKNTAVGMWAMNGNTEGYQNTATGEEALWANTTGIFNTATGVEALLYNTTGNENAALGYQSLRNNVTGSNNTAIGVAALLTNKASENTAVGHSALTMNETGTANAALGFEALKNNTASNNTAVGHRALLNNSTGDYNTANGYRAMSSNSSGNYNTANGAGAMSGNYTGSSNTAMGGNALFGNSSGDNNTAIGNAALQSNETGTDNTSVGLAAMRSNISGNSNAVIGSSALFNNISGHSNVAIGTGALSSSKLQSNLVAIGDSAMWNNGLNIPQDYLGIYNTAVGSKSLFFNTTGISNTATGFHALYANFASGNTANGSFALVENKFGQENSALGASALASNKNGNGNSAFGSAALAFNIDGHENTAMGRQSLYASLGTGNTAVGFKSMVKNTTGANNTAVGWNCLDNATTGNFNSVVGSGSGHDITTGIGNTLMGEDAGDLLATGTNNTFIGRDAFGYINNVNSTALGYQATVANGDNTIRIGNSSITEIGGYQSWTNLSDGRFKINLKENVKGLDFILKLRPVTYNLDMENLAEFNHENESFDKKGNRIHQQPDSITRDARSKKAAIRYSGFVAQEVEAIAKEVGYDFSGISKPADKEKQPYGLRYSEFVVPLVKAVQELSKKNEELGITNEELKKAKAEQAAINAAQQKQIDDLKIIMQQMINSKATTPCPQLAGQ